MWIGLWLLFLIILAPQLLVPLALPAGTVHTPTAAMLSEPTTWPYAFGGSFCHQRPDRSFSLAGNQLPVCVRCLAIELGVMAGLCAAVAVRPRGGFFTALGAFLPLRLRSRAGVLAVGLALMLPMSIDGSLQLVSPYLSATPQRLVTGLLFGIGYAGIVIGATAWHLQRTRRMMERLYPTAPGGCETARAPLPGMPDDRR